ncbi:MAG: DEAD/DEAH box helicase, partial [bacterium]|nr:DEAD/DEAH box helicase [bacterium]
MNSSGDITTSLSLFHPLIKQWFEEQVGTPTDAQVKAWPEIAAGKNVLVSAPTGSGKTLTAFLWAINQLVTGTWPTGEVRILYISPLKALNNDVQKNLIKPLTELRQVFEKAGVEFPSISVLTRSGDTPPGDRRRMLKRPPEILITTPESLNIILSSKNSRRILLGVGTVILDEIHALVGGKRGTHLITAIERLIPLSGEFQRIALSATVNPLERVADFVGGYIVRGESSSSPHYIKRPVSIIRSAISKQYSIKVYFPENAREQIKDKSWWPALVEAFKQVIDANKSTLFFANSRRMTEKVTRF